jgi:transposase
MLERWPAFIRFVDYGRICLTDNAAERASRGIGPSAMGLDICWL